MIVSVALWAIWGIFYSLTWIPFLQRPELLEGPPPLFFWIGMISMIVPLIVMFVWTIYGLWGALRTFQGRDFHYALIGKILPAKGFEESI
jgi:hypothetical protein